ncbi:MAG: amidase family protein [Acidobacteriota bacterium]|jgi:fatty acid amide hydrolase
MTADADIPRMGAARIARAIADGELSAAEAADACIARIEEVNPRLNAVVFERFEEARREAAEADRLRAGGASLGPLHGVPMTIKESLFLEGTPTTGGLPARRGHRADRSSPLVALLREAGAVVLGKTNVPELLLYLEADNPLHGRTLHPERDDRSPGGSSGGEAAIVGAGASPLGVGTDLGGSVRIPSHVCGIHGLMPTAGRLTMAGTFDIGLFPGQRTILAVPGPMARRVEDLTLAMEVMLSGGPRSVDPPFPRVPLGDPGAVRIDRLRVAWFEDDGFFRPAPALRRAVREAAGALADRGAVVEEWTPPDVRRAMDLYFGILSADGAAWARDLLRSEGRHDRRIRDLARLAGMPGFLRGMLAAVLALAGQRRTAERARSVGARSAASLWRLVHEREAYRNRVFGELGWIPHAGERTRAYDLLLCPPSPHPALTHGASYFLTGVSSPSMLFNLLGVPAGVVAATRVRAGEEHDRRRGRGPFEDRVERAARQVEQGSFGLPVGVQVVARPWREDLVLAGMGALEEFFGSGPDYPLRTTT